MKDVIAAAASGQGLNRASLRHALENLTVDSEGMAATITYGGAGPNLANQFAVINAPDADMPLGSRTLVPEYRGSTLNRVKLSAPCAML